MTRGPAILETLFLPLRWLVVALAAVTGLAILTMLAVTCADVVLREIGRPLTGVLDVVQLAGAVAISAAVPYTTAVKGHVAIEYFFHRLSRRSRIVVDTLVRLLGMAFFAVLAWQSTLYGLSLLRAGQVTSTLQLPVYWVPLFIALCAAATMGVILYNLLHPGRGMIRP
jgi:TRAP-type C4-dicarboxylate transport system permease small subunit